MSANDRKLSESDISVDRSAVVAMHLEISYVYFRSVVRWRPIQSVPPAKKQALQCDFGGFLPARITISPVARSTTLHMHVAVDLDLASLDLALASVTLSARLIVAGNC